MIFWKCNNCDEVNSYPQAVECETCGESISANQMEEVKRIEFFLKRAEGGDLHAAVDLYKMYLNGEYLPKNIPEGLKWLNHAADSGLSLAQHELGKLYYDDNEVVGKDQTKAFNWFVKAWNNGYEFSGAYLAVCYMHGYGTPKNEKKGFELLQICANHGLPESQEKLGVFYLHGLGTGVDKQKAYYWLKRSSEIAELTPFAAFQFANLNFLGEGTERNFEEAAKWYRVAFNAGDYKAGYMLSRALLSIGDNQKVAEGLKLLQALTQCEDAETAEIARNTLKDLTK